MTKALVSRLIAATIALLWMGSAHAQVPEQFTIVMVGDTGFNASMEPVHPEYGTKLGNKIAFGDAIANIRGLFDGQINFANLETVVTDRNDLAALPKTFNFRTHPQAIRQLLGTGINVFSAANNHAMDFGVEGAKETLRHLGVLESHGLVAYPGLGFGGVSASSAHVLVWEGDRFRRFDPVGDIAPPIVPPAVTLEPAWLKARRTPDFAVAIGAIGIGGQALPPGEERAGQLSYIDGQDFVDTLDRLRVARVSFRILSAHYGRENDPLTDQNAVQRFRRQAVLAGGVDLVIGHHQHVVAGVELVAGKAIFYGLGNFLHFGTRSLSGNGICRDYGLLAKAHYTIGPDREPVLQALQAIALEGTHRQPKPMPPAPGKMRMLVLNHLAEQFDRPQERARGVRFTPQADGSGLFCVRGAAEMGGRIGALCRDYQEPAYPDEKTLAAIRASCRSQAVAQLEE